MNKVKRLLTAVVSKITAICSNSMFNIMYVIFIKIYIKYLNVILSP